MPAPTFTFKVTANDADPNATPPKTATETTFEVQAFEGEERISQPFEYRLVLKPNPSNVKPSFAKVVNQSAELVMTQRVVVDPGDPTTKPPKPVVTSETSVRVPGIVSGFRAIREHANAANNTTYVEYEAVLVPAFWRLKLFHQSRVFQGLTVRKIIEEVFAQEVSPGSPVLGPNDYEFKLAGPLPAASPPVTKYPAREFCVQYRESDLDFIQRLMEYEGWYYFFDKGKLIISDSNTFPYPLQDPNAVGFTESEAGPTLMGELIYQFHYNEQIVPKTVEVRDYDYEAFEVAGKEAQDTAMANSSTAVADYARVGQHHEHGLFVTEQKYGDDFKKSRDEDLNAAVTAAGTKRTEQIKRIAKVRAQELEAQQKGGQGMSNVARLQAGHLFDLVGHFLFPATGLRQFLITSVEHRYGEPPGATGPLYRNTFTCVPSSMQYRPPRITPVPRAPGVMTAKVVAETPPVPPVAPTPGVQDYDDLKKKYDEAKKDYDEAKERYDNRQDFEGPIDLEGRYRLRIPFDPNQNNASKRVRLAQPHAGVDYGMHFPNRPETEMVFACIDGDPDQPLGLSMVANPWSHSPVPNMALNLGSQNPVAGSAAASDKTTYDPNKNVIRTARGHQIVMDDGNAGANVGITLQTGKAENDAGRDLYWSSKIELGGYRHMSPVEHALGLASWGAGWLKGLVSRDYPGLASQAIAAIASYVNTHNYVDDTFGTTTPVGVNIATNKNIEITGKDGVNITSPNLFGMFSSSLMGEDDTTKRNQYYVEAISKFVVNTVWQDLVNDTVDEGVSIRKNIKEYKAKKYTHSNAQAILNWRTNIIDQRASAFLFTLLQRTGVNISSMGELKMTSLQSTSIAAGHGGLTLNSYAGIEQKADFDMKIEAKQGVRIAAGGTRYETEGLLGLISKKFPGLQSAFQVVSALGERLGRNEEYKDVEFPIELENEEGQIWLHTGGSKAKGKGNILIQTEGEGKIKLFANKEIVHGWSPKEIVLEVGDRGKLDAKEFLNPFEDTDKGKDIGTRIRQTDKVVDVFGKDEVMLSTMKDGSDYYFKIDKGNKIEINCGKASIVMEDNGDITFKGNNIKVEGTGDINIKGMNVESKATKDLKLEGLNMKAKATVKTDIEGLMTTLKGSTTFVKGTIVKVGS